jgi:hypothetical protein
LGACVYLVAFFFLAGLIPNRPSGVLIATYLFLMFGGSAGLAIFGLLRTRKQMTPRCASMGSALKFSQNRKFAFANPNYAALFAQANRSLNPRC